MFSVAYRAELVEVWELVGTAGCLGPQAAVQFRHPLLGLLGVHAPEQDEEHEDHVR
jgi:hypothetical protein